MGSSLLRFLRAKIDFDVRMLINILVIKNSIDIGCSTLTTWVITIAGIYWSSLPFYDLLKKELSDRRVINVWYY